MGLGAAGEPPDRVPLALARMRAGEARALLREGTDPLAHRASTRAARRQAEADAGERTFRAAAAALIESKRPGWRNVKHVAQWLATLEAHAFPVIGDLPVANVGTDEVLRVLRPIWGRIPETASRLRERIEAVLDAARVKGWRTEENPARWKTHLAGELPQPRKAKRVRHRPALAWQDMGAFMAALATRDGIAARALHFLILTGARTGEVRGMCWREIDWNSRLWAVPADRMKAGKLHRVPLSPSALAVLVVPRQL
jgi:integrase